MAAKETEEWRQRFRDGDRALLTEIYRRHFVTVARAAAALLGPADGEAVTQDLFLRLLADPDLRASYRGGAFAAWLVVIGRNAAFTQLRRRRCEVRAGRALELMHSSRQGQHQHPIDGESDARLMVDRFRRHVVPPAWRQLFELRFLGQLSQPECAAALGIPRTTLASQEQRLRRLLRAA